MPHWSEEASDPFTPFETKTEMETVAASPVGTVSKRGVLGEQSALAKGHRLVREISRALRRERVHCLGLNCLGSNCLGSNCLGSNCLGS